MALTFTVQRTTESLATSIVVSFTVGGTATFGTDYTVSGHTTFTATTASLTILAGATSGSIVVTPIADSILEGDESVILTMLPSPGSAQLGANTVATGTILNDDNGLVFTYVSDGDTNGLVYYLGTAELTTAFANPQVNGYMNAFAASTFSGYPITNTTDRQISEYDSDGTLPAWCVYDFIDKSIAVTKYTLRNRSLNTSLLLTNWVLEGSNSLSALTVAGANAATWTTIDTRNNDTTFTFVNQYYTITPNASSTASYRYLRLRMVGTSNPYLIFGEIEFYGLVLRVSSV
jgi:hypothetical protein